MRRFFFFICLAVLLLFPAAVPASQDYFLDGKGQKLFTSEDGLLSTAATALAQTKDGFIWIGGYSGLIRYDGRLFEPFGSGTFSRISDLLGAADGNLWIAASAQGIYCYDNDTFIPVPREESSLPQEAECLGETPSGTIYFGNEGGFGLVTAEGKARLLDIPELNGEYITHIYCPFDDRIFCITRKGELYEYTPSSCRAVDLSSDSQNVRSLFYNDEEELFYIGTGGHSVLVYDTDLQPVRTIDTGSLEMINDLYISGEDVLWLCADNGIGLYREGKVQLMRLKMNNSVDRMLLDAQGSYWFASSRQGVLLVSDSRFFNVSQHSGLPSMVVNAVQAADGRIYIGHDDGLMILDEDTYEIIEDPDFDVLANVRIRSIYRDEDGSLWFATRKKGLLRYKPDHTWDIFDSASYPVIRSDNFRRVIRMPQGIIGGTDAGAYWIDDDGVSDIMDDPEDLSCRVLSMAEKDGTLYMGTDGYGLYLVRDGKVSAHYGILDGLSSNVVMGIVRSRYADGVYLVTGHNLCFLDGDGNLKALTNFPSTNNLDLLIMDNGEVYVLTGSGIYLTREESLLSGKPVVYTRISRVDGMPYEITANASQCVRPEQIYICGSGGLMSLARQSSHSAGAPYQLIIDRVRTEEGEIYVEDTGEAHLGKDVQRIEIGAHVLNYKSDNPFVFYYLEGLDNQPFIQPLSTFGSVVYTNLSGGSYIFHFGTLNGKTRETEMEVRLSIRKDYRWYERTSMRVLITLALLSLAGLVAYLAAHARARWHDRMLRREYEAKEKEHLEAMAFRDYLTGLYNRNYLERWLDRQMQPQAAWPVTFISLDVNDLKKLNDEYGHKAGDSLLVTLSDLLKRHFGQKGCSIIRNGGDEFLVLCSGMDKDTAYRMVEGLRAEARTRHIENVPVTFGTGFCTMDKENFDFEEGLRQSDLNMFADKANYHARK